MKFTVDVPFTFDVDPHSFLGEWFLRQVEPERREAWLAELAASVVREYLVEANEGGSQIFISV